MNRTEEIIKEIQATLDIEPHFSYIEEVGKIQFLSEFLLRSGLTTCENFFPRAKKIYNDFSLNDWKKLFTKCQGKTESLASIIVFLYKFVKVDCLDNVRNMPEIEPGNKAAFNEFFHLWKGILAFTFADERTLSLLNVSFNDMTHRLISEGAKPAIPIEPQYIDISDLLK